MLWERSLAPEGPAPAYQSQSHHRLTSLPMRQYGSNHTAQRCPSTHARHLIQESARNWSALSQWMVGRPAAIQQLQGGSGGVCMQPSRAHPESQARETTLSFEDTSSSFVISTPPPLNHYCVRGVLPRPPLLLLLSRCETELKKIKKIKIDPIYLRRFSIFVVLSPLPDNGSAVGLCRPAMQR